MNFSEDRLIVSSIKKYRDSLPIPTDLVIEIFSRLPAKSVKRYRVLSKFWSKVIQSQYFIDLFAAKSSARPQILFLERNDSGISFLSAHQSSENSSHNIAPTHLTHYPESLHLTHYPESLHLTQYLESIHGNPFGVNRWEYGVPINGLVCVTEDLGTTYEPIIHNPSTGEFLTLPKMKRERASPNMNFFLGYDPTEKQFKVLSIHDWQWFSGPISNAPVEYQVLTLETEELSWRMIKRCTPHCPRGPGICINGVLYYHATGPLNVQLIVCFDVRSETFRFMNIMETFNKKVPCSAGTLTNCDGKLALLISEKSNNRVTGESKSFELWILKDAEKHKWSKDVYMVPPNWKEVVGETLLLCVGMIGSNEIVLSSSFHQSGCVHKYPYIFYFNIEKNSIRRIDIQGMEEAPEYKEVYMYLNHVESLRLFKLLK